MKTTPPSAGTTISPADPNPSPSATVTANSFEPKPSTVVTGGASPTEPKRRYHMPATVKIALLLFTLAGSIVLLVLPNLLGNGVRHAEGAMPPTGLFLLSGLAIIALTAGLFAYLQRLGLGFGKTALVLALGYNAVIAAVKLCLAPLALYIASRGEGLDAAVASPNSPVYYFWVGACVLLLYLFVFRLMYRYYRRKYLAATAAGTRATGKRANMRNIIILGLLIAGLYFTGGGIITIPLWIGAYPGITYVGYVFGLFGLPIVAALVAAMVLVQKGFAAVNEQAIRLRDPMLLAGFFWTGASLILAYHILWIVFLVTLVQLWPFNTYTPK